MVAVICDTLGISALSKHFSPYCTPGLCSQIVHTALTLFYAGVSFLSVLLTAKPTMAGWEPAPAPSPPFQHYPNKVCACVCA